MNTQKTGGPAFPCDRIPMTGCVVNSDGMTMRDYFAAKAMQGIALEVSDCEQAAKWSYEMADAMLKAREY